MSTSATAGEASSVDRAAEAALAELGFPASDVESIERLPQGIKNLNYRVRAGGRDWVLKCHQAATAKERLALSQRLELALDEAGFPVAKLQRLPAGGTVVTTAAGLFTLHAWVGGQQVSIGDRESVHEQHPHLAAGLGTLLGRLHAAGVVALAEAPHGEDVATLLGGPRRTVASIRHGRPHRLRKVLRARLRRPRTSFDRWVIVHLKELVREAKALASPALVQVMDAEDVVLAHNDVNWENLVFDDAFDVVAVLDFDNAAPLPRALEVGAAAAVLVGADGRRLEDFVRAYEQAAGTRVERDAVLVGMRWKCVRSILWSVDAYLSGRVADTGLVERWCTSLHDSLRALPPVGAAGPRQD